MLSIEKVKNQKILVIGDVMLDKYIMGEVTRISPEAPVPVVLRKNTIDRLGGAANVASNLNSLGAQAHLIGIIGKDANGQSIKDIGNSELQNAYFIEAGNRPTTVKIRIISEGTQMLRIDEEDTTPVSIATSESVLSKCNVLIQSHQYDAIILQDYNKGFFTSESISKFIGLGNDNGIPVMVDPKFNNFWDFKGATIFKPNKGELYNAVGSTQIEDIEDIIREAFNRLDCKILITTLADKGIAAYDGHTFSISPTKKIDVIDVSGAGDTTLAVLCLGYINNLNMKNLLEIANAGGRIVCQKSGVSTITLQELLTEVAM